jgi:hypothetical protein
MKIACFRIGLACVLSATVGLAETVECDFNNFATGPIGGQHGWNVYEMVKDSSALSILDEVGTRGEASDKALVLQMADSELRCVTGEPVRWLPGHTLTVEFDFRMGITADEPIRNKPVLSLLIGNSLLSEKARWGVVLETQPNGDWRLAGAMPDSASSIIYGENFLVRPRKDVALSDWYQFTLVAVKKNDPDAFSAKVEIRDTAGKAISSLEFGCTTKDKVSKAMWNLPRVNAGFMVSPDQHGLAVVDNLVVSSAKEPTSN